MVKTDPKVQDRYTRHFAMSKDEVANYLGQLKIVRLQSDALYTVYAAPDSGVLRSKMLKVKKGTRVWVDSEGQTVLLWHCGNPVSRGPRKPLAYNEVGAEPFGAEEDVMSSVPLKTPESAMETYSANLAEPTTPEIPFVSTTPGESDIVIAPPLAGFSIPGWIGAIPGLILITNNGDGGGPPPVPEPGTIAALGLGAAAMLRRRKKSE